MGMRWREKGVSKTLVTFHFFFFKILFIYFTYFYFRLCWFLIAAQASLQLTASRGHSLVRVYRLLLGEVTSDSILELFR